MLSISYYEDSRGKKPVESFIDSLDIKMRAKLFGRLELLEEYGSLLGMPFARHLIDGIYELRTVQGNSIARVLYFFSSEKRGRSHARFHEENPEGTSTRDRSSAKDTTRLETSP